MNEPFGFQMQAPADWTLADLADHILFTMDFDGDHLSQFSVAATPSGRRTPLGPDDESDGMDLPLNSLFPLPKHKKLFYLYDFGASWWFQISKQGKPTTAMPGVTYPRMLAEQGRKPLEYGEDE
ncbi:plasmid pRiA4b ORF-3 family protein [Duganella violaceipulchra]|uniref:Plasmid pRiA4b ORF-3 family protein n=1 Tax=Duganella violaceipulchra TaxID=2849652 RepID=A0AA41H5C2_9BURK|nr:plasmid pRiA4b ORF-3 family protein [Duganella violaceicalia]MBV6319546.1 plasmid pRiA4b ORF-3 family protein [Duganella violaceicalia]MCP2006642.1 hypothetical protein [Duganella violaceicalia]